MLLFYLQKVFRIWMIESFIVMVILAITMTINSFSNSELICSIAVWITFMHAQVADRMQEKQAAMIKPDVHCYKWLTRYFLIKESLWICFFIMTKSYAALTGAVVFFIYPFWRKLYKKLKSSTA
jgi:hypothetical protein